MPEASRPATTAEKPTQREEPASPVWAPYLRVFGAEIRPYDYRLRKPNISIGRSHSADLRLRNRAVSRVHARISTRDNVALIEDCGSSCGTTINGQQIQRHELQHGDTIEVAMYLLQFRTHGESCPSEEASAKAKALLRGEYKALPDSVRVKHRLLFDNPAATTSGADTLPTDRGGLLIQTGTAPGEGATLELEIASPSGKTGSFLGELVAVVNNKGTTWMCVKLHRLSKAQREMILATSTLGPWQEPGGG